MASFYRRGEARGIDLTPDLAATASELAELRALADQRDTGALDPIADWDTGGPACR